MRIGRFPSYRPRRRRLTSVLRNLTAETSLEPGRLMLPVFVSDKAGRPTPIEALPGHSYYPPDSGELISFLSRMMDVGIKSFLLFGVPAGKDEDATAAFDRDGPVQRALRSIRRELGWEPLVATDLCICGYSSHGHCGLPRRCRRGMCIDNDETLELYGRIAVSQAEAGSDIVAPSGMMDGQVAAIRRALDGEGYTDVLIMSYSVKYASSFYGPFRDVMDSAPRFGDRRTYQMDPRNRMEALVEASMDVEEGADILMVKPALTYLDVISLVKREFPGIPLAAYNVSGEYSMLKKAVEAGLLGEDAIVEVLYSIRRAGADIIITYHAAEYAMLRREF